MARQQGRIAKKYARALLELSAPGELDSLVNATEQLRLVWLNSDELRTALTSPAYPLDQRMSALRSLVSKVTGDTRVLHLALLLLENGRISYLPIIASSFKEMVDELRKHVALKISSAFEIHTEEREAIQAKLAKEFGSLSSVDWNTDAELLGGVYLKVGDTVFDGTMRGALERIKSTLTA